MVRQRPSECYVKSTDVVDRESPRGNGMHLARRRENGCNLEQAVRLLLLEDSPDTAATLAQGLLLLDRGYDIERATCLAEAEELVRSRAPDIALIDLTLPDASGCDAALRLRQLAPNLPLVAFTGAEFDAIAVELARYGVQDFLEKASTPIFRVHQVLQLAVERHRRESVLREQACRDSLTNALTRAELERCLVQAISHVKRTGRRGAVLLLDIDDFKAINDTYGHRAGDDVLKDLVKRLTSVARVGDHVGRLGGDEFVLVLEDLKSRLDAVTAVKKALSVTSYELDLGSAPAKISTSIGVAIFPDQSDTASTLLELADQAMYAAKRKRKGTYSFYSCR